MNRNALEEPINEVNIKQKFINLIFENRQISEVTYRKTIVCFFINTLVFLGLSIFFFVCVSSVIQQKLQYYSVQGNTCFLNTTCKIKFQIKEEMTAPIYFMYELGNFYQNHRRYIQSKNNYQLAGNQIDSVEANSCFPKITNADMKVTKSWNGTDLDPNSVASPCGSIAYSFFNDTFSLNKSNGERIYINDSDISWKGDIGSKFKRSPNSSMTQWKDPEDEHFIVWMRTSGLPNFKKPWGRIQQNLPAGNYIVTINNNYNSSEWNGNRYIILTTTSLVGGKNYLLPISFLVISIISLIAVIFFCKRFKTFDKIKR